MRGEDDLVDRRVELRECVAHGGDGIALDHQSVCRDAFVAEQRERPLEPPPGRSAACVLVDHVAAFRLIDGADDRDPKLAVLSALDRLDQRATGDGLVGDDEEVHQCDLTSVSAGARAPFRRACRGPGTPYSYGLPTTCGISSKLKTGCGGETCHASVSERQGI